MKRRVSASTAVAKGAGLTLPTAARLPADSAVAVVAVAVVAVAVAAIAVVADVAAAAVSVAADVSVAAAVAAIPAWAAVAHAAGCQLLIGGHPRAAHLVTTDNSPGALRPL